VKTLRSPVMGACARALRRLAANAWPLLQSTLAATAAWVLANWLGDHRDPFFAPMAAVVALNASRGERGSNAVRLLVGVVVGIVAGELAVGALGGGYGTLTVATFAAMVVAVALGGARVMTAQAATGAILTVAVADGQAGLHRLADALVGAGVALVITQVLFSPQPVALLHRASASWPARSVTSPGRPATGRPGSGPLIAHSTSPARPPAADTVPVGPRRHRRHPDGRHRCHGVRRRRSRSGRRRGAGGQRSARRPRPAARAANAIPPEPSAPTSLM
jgi:Fusaric acid resistance protein-like